MKSTLNPRTLLLSVTAATLLSASAYANCTYELFNIASVKGTTVGEFVDQISDECGISIIIADAEAESILKKQMNKTYLKNLTLNEVLDLIVKENDLQYTLKNNVLKISYLTTKTYNIDYIISERKGVGSTDIRLSSNTGSSSQGRQNSNSQQQSPQGNQGNQGKSSSGSSSESGTNISTIDEVKFWDTLEIEIRNILNRPEDQYKTLTKEKNSDGKETEILSAGKNEIYVNKHAGMVTVTGTGKQIKRLDTYIEDLQKKMQSQVMIDVKMYSVVFNDGSTTGIDWSQIYNLQNFNLGFNNAKRTNVAGGTFDSAYEGDKVQTVGITGSVANTITGVQEPTLGLVDVAGVRAPVDAVSKLFTMSNSISINNLLMFLKTQGDVYSISNPKVMTLNNQPALITAGTELFYRTINTSTLAGGTTGEQAVTEVISSVFSGVLLDITPEISQDGSITLRINPSVSDVVGNLASDNSQRRMPPDLSRRQISSVVTVKDGTRIILGGLINRKSSSTTTKVPLLGDIPVLGYLFKQEGVSEKVEELVVIIEPHIVKKDGSNVGLSDLGYSRLSGAMEKDALKQENDSKHDKKNIATLKEDSK
jgi:general secretion pathway protein D